MTLGEWSKFRNGPFFAWFSTLLINDDQCVSSKFCHNNGGLVGFDGGLGCFNGD